MLLSVCFARSSRTCSFGLKKGYLGYHHMYRSGPLPGTSALHHTIPRSTILWLERPLTSLKFTVYVLKCFESMELKHSKWKHRIRDQNWKSTEEKHKLLELNWNIWALWFQLEVQDLLQAKDAAVFSVKENPCKSSCVCVEGRIPTLTPWRCSLCSRMIPTSRLCEISWSLDRHDHQGPHSPRGTNQEHLLSMQPCKLWTWHVLLIPPMDNALATKHQQCGNMEPTHWNLAFLGNFGSMIRYMIICAMIRIKTVHVVWPSTQSIQSLY